MRVLFIILGVLAALVLIAAAGLALALDPLVLRVARTQSAKALGVPVRIDDADASFGGRLELEGFDAGNPEGFAEPRSVRFDRVTVKARLGSVLEKVLDVDELVVERPALTIEFKGTRSNLGVLLDHLAKPGAEKTGDGMKFRVRRLRVEGASVRFRSDVLGGSPSELTLPNVELANVGTSDDAATTSELLAVILKSLGTEAMKAGKAILPSDLLNALGGDLEGAAKRFGIPGLEKEIERQEDDLEKGLERLKVPKP